MRDRRIEIETRWGEREERERGEETEHSQQQGCTPSHLAFLQFRGRIAVSFAVYRGERRSEVLDLNSPFPAIRTRLGGVLAAQCIACSCLAPFRSLLRKHVVLASWGDKKRFVGRKRSEFER